MSDNFPITLRIDDSDDIDVLLQSLTMKELEKMIPSYNQLIVSNNIQFLDKDDCEMESNSDLEDAFDDCVPQRLLIKVIKTAKSDLEIWLSSHRLKMLLSALNENEINYLEDLKLLKSEQDIDAVIQELSNTLQHKFKFIQKKKFKKCVTELIADNNSNINTENIQNIENNKNVETYDEELKKVLQMSKSVAKIMVDEYTNYKSENIKNDIDKSVADDHDEELVKALQMSMDEYNDNTQNGSLFDKQLAQALQRSLDADDEKKHFEPHTEKSFANPGHGIVYFQTEYYDQEQMSNVDSRFNRNINQAPKILFGDNYCDRKRDKSSERERFGGQSKIMGYWDRMYGFGIPTAFDDSLKTYGFVYNESNFKTLMKELFGELIQHLQNGCDIIVPYPTSNDLLQRPGTFFKNGKQLIYHNIGTGIANLSLDHLFVIQQYIDELKKYAQKVEIVDKMLYSRTVLKKGNRCDEWDDTLSKH